MVTDRPNNKAIRQQVRLKARLPFPRSNRNISN